MAELTPADRARLTAGADMWSTAAMPAHGIPPLRMADGPMGIASGRVDERDVALLTPCGVALGASWDTALLARVGALVGGEARRMGVNAVLAPNLNLPRSPLAGRAFELYSEDPFLAGSLGCAWLGGLQSQGVGSVPKHLVCNDSETQRNTMNAVVDQVALREIYLRPFEMAAAAGCLGLMAAYNRLNGIFCVQHPALLEDIVKRDWNFPGFLVSDWFGVLDAAASARAGLDLDMPGPDRMFGTKLLAMVEAGELPPARLHDASDRVAIAARRVAGWTVPQAPAEAALPLLEEAAAAGFVLLKNDGLLPLKPSALRRLAVIGPNATAPCFQGGTFAKISLNPATPTPIEAIRAVFGPHCEIVFEPGVDPTPRLPPLPAITTDGSEAPGMVVAYFAGHDFAAPFATETRNTNCLTWFSALPGVGAMDREAGVSATGLFTPTADGVHIFYIGGTGAVRLRLDGATVFDCAETVSPADIMGVLKRGDAHEVEVSLKAGVPVRVEAELRILPARAQGLWYGVRQPDNAAAMLARAVAAAKAADAVVLVLGETADSGVESRDRESTALPEGQLALLRAVCAVNPRVAVVANVAHAFDVSWDGAVQALLVTWYAGQGFAPALAAVLAGTREPSGRLPISIAARDADYPAFDLQPDKIGDLAYTDGNLPGYLGLSAKAVPARYPFGFGLGYARFAWTDPTMDVTQDGVVLRVQLRNMSDRSGKDIVQVYVAGPQGAAVAPPRLEGFACVTCDEGAGVEATISLPPRAFAFWDSETAQWRILDGPYRVTVAHDAQTPFAEFTILASEARWPATARPPAMDSVFRTGHQPGNVLAPTL